MEMHLPYFKPSAELSVQLRLMQGETALPEHADAERLRRMLDKNRLLPMAAQRLCGARSLPFDADAAELTAMRQISTLGKLTRLFEKNGVRALAVKGPALAMEVYSTPSLREYHDLDFLVPLSQVEKAEKLLMEDGWKWYEADVITTPKRRRESYHLKHHDLFIKGDLYVELHWRLLPWDHDEFESMWDARRETMLGGAKPAVQGEIHQLHHLVCHGVRHGFHRLKWLADLAVLLPRHADKMQELWQSMQKTGQEICLPAVWLLLFSFKELEMPQQTAFASFVLKRGEDGVTLTCAQKDRKSASRAVSMVQTLLPLLESQEDIEDTPAFRQYRKRLPNPRYLGGWGRRFLRKLRPPIWLWQRCPLPDRWFFLYWPLRPAEKIWREIKKGVSKAPKSNLDR